MREQFAKILKEKDSGIYSGELELKYSQWLSDFFKNKDFLEIIRLYLNKTIDNLDCARFEFLAYLILSHGRNSSNQQELYLLMMDFLNDYFYKSENNDPEGSTILELVLDLFWHQDEGLKNLNKQGQQKLHKTLRLSAKHRYEITENGDDIFFAISKSMDLIKYQKDFGDSEELIDLYLNHYDDKIKERSKEYKENNWL